MLSQGRAEPEIQESARGQKRQGSGCAVPGGLGRGPGSTRVAWHRDTGEAGRGTGRATAAASPARVLPAKGQGKTRTKP